MTPQASSRLDCRGDRHTGRDAEITACERSTDQEMPNRQIQFQSTGVHHVFDDLLRLDIIIHEAAPFVVENSRCVVTPM